MKSTAITRYFLVFLLSLLTLTVTTTPAGAQTAPATSYAFTVDTTADTHDAHPGDGVCADSSGQCSLRAAIEEADALPKGSSVTITVPAGTYGLTLGTLGLTANTITIHGVSSKTTIIKGNNTFEIMSISANVSASLGQLTIEGGSVPKNGGGIYNGGTLTVTHSTLSGNSATSLGGGIYNNGTVSVSNSTLSGNSADYGGGIENGGRLTVKNSTFSSNSAGGYGGGIENDGTLSVSTSTFSSNSTVYKGGGIENYGTLTMTNSTLSHNYGGIYGGGGIYNGGTLTVTHSTLSGNSANKGAWGGGIANTNGSTVTLTAAIVANSPRGGNCAGTITDSGYNLDSGTSCGFSLSTDLNNTDPMLGPLKNNGGPTQTMALLQGSKAIDWVAASSYPVTDQRGYMRPDGSGESMCDIGAYESAY